MWTRRRCAGPTDNVGAVMSGAAGGRAGLHPRGNGTLNMAAPAVAGAAPAVAIGAVILWLIGSVQPWDVVRYLGYEAAFVVAPGWLVLLAICPGIRSRAWQLALGWPIGLTLEILGFAATAALGIRGLFLAYPLVVGIPALLIAKRRGGLN